MKKLKKILLINWLYFSKQIIEVDDINFITGKNGSGKSTVIDALQIVLLGETNARNFNKAASDSSQRSLDGYLRADMDDKNTKSRKGKDFSSYIACEFWDDVSGDCFVIGIVFDCRNDGSRQERFFTFDGMIPGDCFILDKRAMDITQLRQYIKALPNAHGILYDSQKQYRTDLLAKWNVHTEQVHRMLKKAVSFKPIVNIQDFITENICDIPDKPDIELMQQNIRDYKQHERLAQRQEEKLLALNEISQLHREFNGAIDRLQQQRFLVLWAAKEDLNTKIAKMEQQKTEAQQEIERLDKEEAECKNSLEQKGNLREKLIAERAKSDIYQAEIRLREQKRLLILEQEQINTQIEKLVLEIKAEAVAIIGLCNKIVDFSDFSEIAPLSELAQSTIVIYNSLSDTNAQSFGNSLTIFEQTQDSTALFAQQLQAVNYQIESIINQLQAELDETLAALSKLSRNVKDYPRGLQSFKDELTHRLAQKTKKNVEIHIMADVLELADGQELWRAAVEGYLSTNKFYLLVSPELYPQALEIYNELKNERNHGAFGLVDIGRLREKESLTVWDDSLAKKITTENSLAQDYIAYLLGRVVCCAHVGQLRRHRTAITAEGMVYSGYVAKPLSADKMQDTFIGRQAVALRIERLTVVKEKLSDQIEAYTPVKKLLSSSKERDYLITQRFVSGELEDRRLDYLRSLEVQQELLGVDDELSHLNLFWLEELGKQIDALKSEIRELNSKLNNLSENRGELRNKVHTMDYESLPDLYQTLASKEDAIEESFSAEFCQNIGIPRYTQELARLRKASVVLKNFGDRLPQTQKEQEAAWQKLRQTRGDYVSKFQPCSFRVDHPLNDEFDAERKLLEESELPQYREKIQRARESALEQFQNDFLSKLKSSIDQVLSQVKNLNKALKQARFGTDSYEFYVGRSPDYAEYYDMIMAPELMEGDAGLFALPFQQKYGALIEDLFGRIAGSDDSQLNARKQSELQQNIERYTDYRTYLKFDLQTTDQNGSRQMLSQTLNTKSGGETQTPFYIAVLASFAQLYQVNHLSALSNNTVRLVVFDEAFNKMDSDRIIESIRLLRKMGLQAIICTPPDKLPDIMPEADRTLLVCKEKYQMHILPYGKEMVQAWSEI